MRLLLRILWIWDTTKQFLLCPYFIFWFKIITKVELQFLPKTSWVDIEWESAKIREASLCTTHSFRGGSGWDLLMRIILIGVTMSRVRELKGDEEEESPIVVEDTGRGGVSPIIPRKQWWLMKLYRRSSQPIVSVIELHFNLSFSGTSNLPS